jgi:hypothetical protein
MDELAELRALRVGLAAAPADARAAARERLLGAAAHEPRLRSAARERLLRAPAPRRRGRRRALLATATAVAAAGATVAIVSGLDEGHVAPPPATAAEVLNRAAQTAERTNGPGVPRDDQYFYVASEGTELVTSVQRGDSYSFLYTKQREIWLSVDRPGLLRDHHVGGVRWLSQTDREKWIENGRPRVQGASVGDTPMDAIHHYFIGDEQLTTEQLIAFDPTPQQLFDRLRSRVGDRGQSPNGEVFVEIADALREAPQTPQLRATLYRALALVPGVQLLGDVKDRLGRDAIGVAYTEHTGLRQELLFDPQTAEVLNEREVVVHPVQGLRAAVGTAVEDIVYTKRAVTDATTRP